MAKTKRSETAIQTDQQGMNQQGNSEQGTGQQGMSGPPDRSEPRFVGETSSSDSERERVAQRAYELYLARGGGDGQAMEDWLSAERELIEGNENQSES
jgi:Protein of unknown function (DUF2934)